MIRYTKFIFLLEDDDVNRPEGWTAVNKERAHSLDDYLNPTCHQSHELLSPRMQSTMLPPQRFATIHHRVSPYHKSHDNLQSNVLPRRNTTPACRQFKQPRHFDPGPTQMYDADFPKALPPLPPMPTMQNFATLHHPPWPSVARKKYRHSSPSSNPPTVPPRKYFPSMPSEIPLPQDFPTPLQAALTPRKSYENQTYADETSVHVQPHTSSLIGGAAPSHKSCDDLTTDVIPQPFSCPQSDTSIDTMSQDSTSSLSMSLNLPPTLEALSNNKSTNNEYAKVKPPVVQEARGGVQVLPFDVPQVELRPKPLPRTRMKTESQ